MKMTVLGSGTSSGVPTIGCPCAVCKSSNPKNKRLRSSCWVQKEGKSLIIDTGPDLRQQALTQGIDRVDGVLYTHIHADHVCGLDDLRMYNAHQQASIPIFGDEKTLKQLQVMFPYVFGQENGYPSLTPKLTPHVVSGRFQTADVWVQSIPCNHGGNFMVQNYRVGNGAWLTDINGIPEESLLLLKNLEVLFIDGLRLKPHPTHFHLDETLKMCQRIGAKKTYLIHLTHDYDHDSFNKTLPNGIELAYDGLTVEFEG